ncbi:MAG TPA: DUF1045 domain-containing protein [Acetobacteraceae bacterium]|nr:DUF1045 domain-containing protein [Acetobacteraceae bacterium]
MRFGPEARVAFYYAPAADDPLALAAESWYAARAPLTDDARHYGFHATLKPPMRLRERFGWDDVLHTAQGIAASVPPFALPPLTVADLHGFLALRETEPCPELQALADACVAGADHLRAPSDADERARRRRARLSAAEDANLVRWGYPYVFATWVFHMTLTCRLDTAARADLQRAATAHFAEALAQERRVADLCLFVQKAPGAAFTPAARIALGAG